MIGSFFILTSFISDALESLKGLKVNFGSLKNEKILCDDKNNKIPMKDDM